MKHSQRMNEPPLRPWVVLHKDGQIVCCHYNCMAGLGETCSHAAAAMFAFETLCRMKQETTCTSLPCEWLKPSASNVPYAEASSIDFSSPAQKRKCTKGDVEIQQKKMPAIPPPSEEETAAFCTALASSGSQCAILSVKPGFGGKYVPRAILRSLPAPLTSLYCPANMDLSETDLKEKCEEIFSQLKISQDEVRRFVLCAISHFKIDLQYKFQNFLMSY